MSGFDREMAENVNINDSIAASADDTSSRRSSRVIKRRKFDDELVDFGTSATSGLSLLKTQPIRSQQFNMSSTSMDEDDVMYPFQSIPEAVIPSIVSSTSSTQPRKVRSNKMPTSTSTLNKLQNTPSTSAVPSLTNKIKPKKQKNLNSNFGRWKPADDFMLIQNVLQTNHLPFVHRGVKFSCEFTLKEIEKRWCELMYDQAISKTAISAMRNLHPEIIAKIESKILFSLAEEDLLATMPSDSQPTIETFQELLSQNPNIFHRKRSAKILMTHWQLMKQYSILSDQRNALETPIVPFMRSLEHRNNNILNNEQEVSIITMEPIPTFAECEELLKNKSSLTEETDPVLQRFLSIENKKVNEQIKTLEYSLPVAQELVYPSTGVEPFECDPDTLAVLRGRSVKYLMKSKEITVGRSSKYHQVDLDLNLEGPALKISRQQAIIRLVLHTGEFFIIRQGKTWMYVNGKPLLTGILSPLKHNSVVEIHGLKFVFFINEGFVDDIKEILDLIKHNKLIGYKKPQTSKFEETELSIGELRHLIVEEKKLRIEKEKKKQEEEEREELSWQQQKRRIEEEDKKLEEMKREKLLWQQREQLEDLTTDDDEEEEEEYEYHTNL